MRELLSNVVDEILPDLSSEPPYGLEVDSNGLGMNDSTGGGWICSEVCMYFLCELKC